MTDRPTCPHCKKPVNLGPGCDARLAEGAVAMHAACSAAASQRAWQRLRRAGVWDEPTTAPREDD